MAWGMQGRGTDQQGTAAQDASEHEGPGQVRVVQHRLGHGNARVQHQHHLLTNVVKVYTQLCSGSEKGGGGRE